MSTPSDVDAPIAAIDLGSNSFHMVIAQEGPEGVRLLDRLREGVRLAAGLQAGGRIDPLFQARALDCLQRFGQRIRGFPPERVRAVGTSTLRNADNEKQFLQSAEDALGYPIDIISGREEARLIYLGVAHSLAMPLDEQRMVIDIGGGSTEIIVGKGFAIDEAESLSLGAVTASTRYFPQNEFNGKALKQLEDRVQVAIEAFAFRFKQAGWQKTVGASGTIRAIGRILEAQGSGPNINAAGMVELRQRLLDLKSFSRFKEIKGLKDERVPILAGGFVILHTLMRILEIESIEISEGALREGVLYELLGRIHQEDTREITISSLQTRFHVDPRRKIAIEKTALHFFTALSSIWQLSSSHQYWLRWAVATFDIGLDIAHEGFQKHGEYILRHADLPGFSRREQFVLAALVRLQRKAMVGLDSEIFSGFSDGEALKIQRLAVLLRLSILFHRGNLPPPFLPGLSLENPHTLRLTLPDDWQTQMPLLAADLEHEQSLLLPHYRLRW